MTAPGLEAADPLRQFRLDGRVAVVTGASSGLGARFAQVLDAAGARVVLVARRRALLEQLAASLHKPVIVVADLAAPNAVEAVVGEVSAEFDAVDVLVNNAGITHPIAAEDEDEAGFHAVMQLNLEVPFHLSRAFARLSWNAGRPLSIVNISSIMGLIGSRGVPEASYVASKGALISLSRELANQWARRGVRVNTIAPGWFPSEITMEKMIDDPEGSRFIRRNTPMGRVGAIGELDGALLFLAGDASSYVTGQSLVVDGGWSII